MKKLILFLISITFLGQIAIAQNGGLNFQGLARNSVGAVLASQKINLKFSILKTTETGTVEYTEIKDVTTNPQGIFSVVIGEVDPAGFAAIDWKLAPKFLKVELDPSGGNNFVDIGTTMLQNVPFAFYANGVNAGNIDGILSVANGGTGANTTEEARANLGLVIGTDVQAPLTAGTDYLTPTGTAAAATKLETARNINGVAFDGTSDITITADGTSLTGTVALASGGTGASTAADARTNLGLVIGTDVQAPLTAGTDYLTPTGTAAAATKLETARNINGVAFDGTSDITITADGTSLTGTVALASGGTGASTAADARTNLGLVIGTDVQAPLTAGTDYLTPTGTAAAATKLETARNINGVAFDGTSDITITADGTSLTGTVALASGGTGASTAADARTNLGLVIGTDVQAPLTAGTDYLTPTGTAAAATKLETARNINGVAFDGTSDITITADGTSLTGTVALASGGTGANTAADARTNLGLVIGTDVQAPLTAGTDYLTPTGTAAAATKLETARNINGVAFDGTSDITITADGTSLTSLVPVSKGGTGDSTITGLVVGNGSSTMSGLLANVIGETPRWNGTTWVTTGENGVAIGNNAGQTDQGYGTVALGLNAGNNTQGTFAIAIGNNAGKTTQNQSGIAIGENSGYNLQNIHSIAIGSYSGYESQGSYSLAMGYSAANNNQSDYALAIGPWAGNNTQGSYSIAFGLNSGANYQGLFSLAIGFGSGQYSQGNNSIAIGVGSGNNLQSTSSIALGNYSGYDHQNTNSLAIGSFSGMYNQGQYAVAVGSEAANIDQGTKAISIGYSSGFKNQGEEAIAMGVNAGNNYQNSNAIALGSFSGFNQQSQKAISIGTTAGKNTQGLKSIAIGDQAGFNNQGENAIAIGSNAGYDSQSSNSIVINASGYELDAANSGLFVKPVRNQNGSSNGLLNYDINTGEITYDTFKTFVINHPTKPENYLVHAAIEGPEAGVYYRGEAKIENNHSVKIALPDYVSSFANNFTIQITQIYEENQEEDIVLKTSRVKDNSFTVYGKNTSFYWVVYGQRGTINVEPKKSDFDLKGDGPYRYLQTK